MIRFLWCHHLFSFLSSLPASLLRGRRRSRIAPLVAASPPKNVGDFFCCWSLFGVSGTRRVSLHTAKLISSGGGRRGVPLGENELSGRPSPSVRPFLARISIYLAPLSMYTLRHCSSYLAPIAAGAAGCGCGRPGRFLPGPREGRKEPGLRPAHLAYPPACIACTRHYCYLGALGRTQPTYTFIRGGFLFTKAPGKVHFSWCGA